MARKSAKNTERSRSPAPPASLPPAGSTAGQPGTSTAAVSTTSAPKKKGGKGADNQAILHGLWERYLDETPRRIRFLDVFLGFLVVVGVLQFVYCVIGGNYPFNAFLAGFSATVGQFVLTVSLRMQSVEGNRKEFKQVSPERAFADFILGSLLLHAFCVNFIN